MRWFRRLLTALVLLPVLYGPAWAALGLPSPSQLFSDLIGKLTGGAVVTQGISGWPNALHFDRLELRDAEGAWLIAEDVDLDWHPYLLVTKQASIDLLSAGRLQVPRLQAQAAETPATPPSSSPSSGLPVSIEIKKLHVGRAEIGAPVLGTAAALSLDGSVSIPSLETPTAHLEAHRLDGGGDYKIDAALTADRIDAKVVVAEPEHGLIALIAKLPDIGKLDIQATVAGPRNALATDVTLAAGPLNADAKGTVDLNGQTLDLQVHATAPAMKPAPEVAWQAIQLQAHVQGPFTTPNANGHLQIDNLAAAGAAVRQLAADLSGNAGQVKVHAVADGLRIPGPDATLLAEAPLTLDATAQLDDPARPVTFKLAHPLLSAEGKARTAAPIEVAADIALARLAPFAAIGGVDLQGSTALHVNASMQDGTT